MKNFLIQCTRNIERFYNKVTQTWIRNVSTNDVIDEFDAEDDEIILAAINVGMYQLC